MVRRGTACSGAARPARTPGSQLEVRQTMDTDYRPDLSHVYWIGGTSAAAKSTVSRRIASLHDMILYSTDDVMGDHAKRCSPEECPMLESFKQMTMDERWVDRTPELMYKTFHWFHGECFQSIVEDLLSLPRDRKILAEGFRLLPALVKPLIASTHRAVWLISTPDFREAVFGKRRGFWNRTTHPERALRNLLTREVIFMDHLIREAESEGLTTIVVDGSCPEDDLVDSVCSHFEL